MKNLEDWGVSLEDIPPEGLTVEFKDITDLKDIKVIQGFSGFFKLKKIGIELKLEGFLKGKIELICDRCLSPFEFSIEHSFKIDLKPLASLNFEGEKELSEEEMEVSFYEDDWISFYNLLKEEIILAIPYKKLCKKDCKGLCPICGANLNENPCNCKREKKNTPFAVLKEMFKNKNLEKGG